jgi:hypothetical protein
MQFLNDLTRWLTQIEYITHVFFTPDEETSSLTDKTLCLSHRCFFCGSQSTSGDSTSESRFEGKIARFFGLEEHPGSLNIGHIVHCCLPCYPKGREFSSGKLNQTHQKIWLWQHPGATRIVSTGEKSYSQKEHTGDTMILGFQGVTDIVVKTGDIYIDAPYHDRITVSGTLTGIVMRDNPPIITAIDSA